MRPDPISLASGAVIAALGALVLLDSAGAIELTLGWLAVAVTAGVGVIVLLSGLIADGGERHD